MFKTGDIVAQHRLADGRLVWVWKFGRKYYLSISSLDPMEPGETILSESSLGACREAMAEVIQDDVLEVGGF